MNGGRATETKDRRVHRFEPDLNNETIGSRIHYSDGYKDYYLLRYDAV
jgi:hypothetical protein